VGFSRGVCEGFQQDYYGMQAARGALHNRFFRLGRGLRKRRGTRASTCLVESLESRQLLSGTWTALSHAAPAIIDYAFLLSDGRVMAQINQDSTSWAILTPSSSGSYINGTWSTVASSNDTRLYHSTTVLPSGKVFVAGGEYGAGGATAEIYDPVANTWTKTAAIPSGDKILDAESMLLPNGNVLVGAVASSGSIEYNPTTNTWTSQSIVSGRDLDEKTWVKLPDGSIITPDGYQSGDETSERFIPSENKWITDANMPVNLIDGEGEMGPGFLLPNGSAFFIGATGNTAYYKPSGTTADGTWTAGPVLPNGLGDDDAPGAELPDGTLLLDLGPTDSYNGPSSYYIFNPTDNIYTAVSGAPDTSKEPFINAFLDLPDGNVMWTDQVESTAYEYNPGVTPLATTVPTITGITANSDGSYQLTGAGLNGQDQGASYGDDNQMDSNYPIIRLTTTTGSSVYYAKTSNWSSGAVATGSTPVTTDFTLPTGLAANGTYYLYTVANGVPSNYVTVYTSTSTQDAVSLQISPTPATVTANATVQLTGTALNSSGGLTTTDPGLHWSVVSGGGSINSSGLYTAPATGGLAVIALTCGTLVMTTEVGIVNSPWVSADIGSPTLTGIAYDSGGVTTLQGSGTDIAGTSDQFRFDYLTMTGNGSITAEVDQTSSIAYSQAGVMIRNTLAANSAVAFATEDYEHYSYFYDRSTAGGSVSGSELVQGGEPYWVRLIRNGNSFTAYASPDGSTWTQIGSTQTISMNSIVYVGLADSANTNSSLSTATFSNVLVSNPTVAAAAAGTPSPSTGTSVSLSVLGANTPNPSGESSLTYTWTATSSPTGSSAKFTGNTNGTNAAKSITAAVTGAGTYQFTVTISDGTISVTSAVSVTFNATLTSIAVLPSAPSLSDGQTQQFSAIAYDQFGNALSTQPTFGWTIDSGGVGSINTTGLYTAPVYGTNPTTVRASYMSVSGTASVNVILSVIDGTSGNDTIRLVRSSANLLVYINSPITPAYNVSYGSLGSLTVADSAGTDTVNVDFSGGSTPVPIGGLTVTGGSGNDTLIVTGTTGSDLASINSTTIIFNGSPITYSGIESILINGNGGTDSFIQTAQPGDNATVAFNGGTTDGPSINDTLNISSGTYSFAAPKSGAGVAPISLAALSIGNNASVSIGTATSQSDRWVLVTYSLSMAASSQLELGGNDMIVRNTGSLTPAQSLTNVTSLVASGFNGGQWNGPGIISTAALTDTTHLTSLGVISNAAYASFDGQPVSSTDVLVKYTYYGDADLNGKVDGSDYSLIDNGNLTHATGWANGDFNYDGAVNGSDYTLIDNAFNSQGTIINAQTAALISTSNEPLANKSAAFVSPSASTDPATDPDQEQISKRKSPNIYAATFESQAT
jgi:hypothetical protein